MAPSSDRASTVCSSCASHSHMTTTLPGTKMAKSFCKKGSSSVRTRSAVVSYCVGVMSKSSSTTMMSAKNFCVFSQSVGSRPFFWSNSDTCIKNRCRTLMLLTDTRGTQSVLLTTDVTKSMHPRQASKPRQAGVAKAYTRNRFLSF